MFKHFIWDFDGTLFDTYPAMVGAFQQALQEFGIEESCENIYRLMKISVPHAIQHYQSSCSIPSDFPDAYNQHRREAELHSTAPFPAVREVCAEIVRKGGCNYLYTHRGYSAKNILEAHELFDLFADFITKEDGFELKPSPQAIRYLIKKHHMDPAEAIMIGDREIDLLAGKNAGISACYFNNDQSGPLDCADYTVTALRQMPDLLAV